MKKLTILCFRRQTITCSLSVLSIHIHCFWVDDYLFCLFMWVCMCMCVFLFGIIVQWPWVCVIKAMLWFQCKKELKYVSMEYYTQCFFVVVWAPWIECIDFCMRYWIETNNFAALCYRRNADNWTDANTKWNDSNIQMSKRSLRWAWRYGNGDMAIHQTCACSYSVSAYFRWFGACFVGVGVCVCVWLCGWACHRVYLNLLTACSPNS